MITGDFHTHGSFSHGKGSALKNAEELFILNNIEKDIFLLINWRCYNEAMI